MTDTKHHLQGLFKEQIKDAFSAETQLLAALPKLRDAANDTSLRELLGQHLTETEEHALRIRAICDELDCDPAGHRCKAMAGLIAEADDVIRDTTSETAVLDAALICAVQKIEHYEIALYGCLCAYARMLRLEDPQALLQQTLDDERRSDATLTEIAELWINAAATAEHR